MKKSISESDASVATHEARKIPNWRSASVSRSPKSEPHSYMKTNVLIGDLDPSAWLASIVEGSQDAIISKDLEGNIRSWNPSACRLFGYQPDEVIGLPITILIPEDRHDEEMRILAEIRAGNRVEHFETIRRRKDGRLIDISLTISPVRNKNGIIVGASKIARDITERRQAQEQQSLLLREMQHRIKNLYALVASIVSLSARLESDAASLVRTIQERLAALSRAHDLTVPDWRKNEQGLRPTTLQALLQTILQPYESQAEARITIEGDDPLIGSKALTNMALLLHELATNSAKYGSLSVSQGRLSIFIKEHAGEVHLTWTETEGPEARAPQTTGFGNRLEESIQATLGTSIIRDWRSTGLVIEMTVPSARLVE